MRGPTLQWVDTVALQEGGEAFWGEWSYGQEGRFFLRIVAEDQGGTGWRPVPSMDSSLFTISHSPDRPLRRSG